MRAYECHAQLTCRLPGLLGLSHSGAKFQECGNVQDSRGRPLESGAVYLTDRKLKALE